MALDVTAPRAAPTHVEARNLGGNVPAQDETRCHVRRGLGLMRSSPEPRSEATEQSSVEMQGITQSETLVMLDCKQLQAVHGTC